jgi:chromosome partitioning protein
VTRLVALANQKGGVGKTTTAINLGAALAARDQSVLIIDMDPQGNATAGLGLRAPEGKSTYQLLLKDVAVNELAIATAFAGLAIVPGSADLAGAEVELTTLMAREYQLRRAIEGEIDRYRFVLIDCPPSVGLLTINALTASHEVIVPVQCEYLALEGLGQFVGLVDRVRRYLNPELRLRGVLLTMFDRRTNLSQQVADEVRQHFPNTFRATIPRSVRLSEAPSHGLPISAYDPRSPAADAYAALAGELMESAPVVAGATS